MSLLAENPSPERPDTQADRWRLPKLPLVIAVVALLGVSVLLYPSTAAWFASVRQSEQIKHYTDDVRQIPPAERVEALAKAEAYNSALTGGANLEANNRLPVARGDSSDDDEYRGLLNADNHGLMARITIPAIDVDLPVYHGTSDPVLQKGIGHLEGTALPVGGESTRSVLTGHRGLSTSTLFTHLDKVKTGDKISIETFGKIFMYRVTESKVVEPDDTAAIRPVLGKDLLTLVTCTPLGINSQRILVTGERIDAPDADASSKPAGPGFPWWALYLGGTVLLLAGYVYFSGRPVKKKPATVDAE